MEPMTSLMWFRRDLRTRDNPALLAALDDGPTLPLFVLDPVLWTPAGPSRRSYLRASLASLSRDLPLVVVEGDPVERVVEAARAIDAGVVHLAADYGPYGARRDAAVEEALAAEGIDVVRTGSPYAVAPGRVLTGQGGPYQVFTPFSKAWVDHGWRAPAPGLPKDAEWVDAPKLEGRIEQIPETSLPDGLELPEAGEDQARKDWSRFLEDAVADYDEDRDRPDLEGTSRMSHHLKWGEIHPRTMLADLSRAKGPLTYRKELAWREFYADVLFQRPDSARDYLKPQLAGMDYDAPGSAFEAWREGRTGFPIVDAGLRQLRGSGWMHNRVRMIVASFLVKDLHVEWQYGARHFMHWLVDGDLASNSHGWQWTAGSGTDASPFFRVFNPTSQGRRFDPDGAYVRAWVPELADLDAGEDPHDPSPEARSKVDYPDPIVDHQAERREALDRYESVKAK